MRIFNQSMDERLRIEQPVAEAYKRFLDDYAESLRSSTRQLQAAIDQLLTATGKHVRPLIVLLAAKACGKVTDDTINSAVLIELLHTATLIHDDVVDDTKQRRGVPSLNAIFDNRIAVLVGDYILSTALVRSIWTRNLRVVHLISQLGKNLSEGEIAQLETAEEHILNEACYLEVIRKKTAALLSACAEIGAISAEVDEQTIALCSEFGEAIGYCFQIKDDIFDYYDDKSIGKPTGNDIREGKITLPLLHALQTADKALVAPLLKIIDTADFTDENVHMLIDFAKNHGGIEYAESRMKVYHNKALTLLNQLPASDAREALALLTDYIINRKK